MVSTMLLTWLSTFAMNLMITSTSVWQVNVLHCRVWVRSETGESAQQSLFLPGLLHYNQM